MKSYKIVISSEDPDLEEIVKTHALEIANSIDDGESRFYVDAVFMGESEKHTVVTGEEWRAVAIYQRSPGTMIEPED